MTLHFAFSGVFSLLFMLLLIISDSFLLLYLHLIPAVISISVSILSLVWIYFSLLLCMWVLLSHSPFSYLTSLPLKISLPHTSFWGQERERNICQLQTQEIYSPLYLFYYYFKDLIWWTHSSCCMKYSLLQQTLLYTWIAPCLH